MNIQALIVVALSTMFCCGALAAPPEQHIESIVSPLALEAGKPAPDFRLTDSNGKSHTLSALKGKYVVLEWVNFQCPFVKKHYDSGNMQKLEKTYTKKGVVWLSINSSAAGKSGNYPPGQVNALLKEKGASPTAYLLDGDGKVGRLYGAKTTPQMFVVDPHGTIVYGGAIDDRPTTDGEDVAGAKNYVQEALDLALQGKAPAVAWTKSYGCSVKY